jgi:hypothetical protein
MRVWLTALVLRLLTELPAGVTDDLFGESGLLHLDDVGQRYGPFSGDFGGTGVLPETGNCQMPGRVVQLCVGAFWH